MPRKNMANQMSDVIRFRGFLEWALKNTETGEIIDSGGANVVCSTGRAWMLKRLGSTDANQIDRIYLGTDTQSPTSTVTALADSFSSASFGTRNTDGTTADPPYMTFSVSWTTNETHDSSSNIEEFGIYASTGPIVGYLTTSAAINFGTSNTLAITYTLSN